LDTLEEFQRHTGLTEEQVKPIRQSLLPAGRYKDPVIKVTVHRYHPRDDPFGPLGLLNPDRGRLEALIERGFKDAAEHDCIDSRCVLAQSTEEIRAAA